MRDEVSVDFLAERVDVARIGPLLEGFEITSDLDRLTRLPGQVKAFGGVFDRLTLVTGPALAYSGSLAVPEWWGLMVVTRRPDHSIHIREVRRAQPNPAQLASKVAGMLWREELREAVRSLSGKVAPKRATRAQLCTRLQTDICTARVRDFVAGRLLDPNRAAIYGGGVMART